MEEIPAPTRQVVRAVLLLVGTVRPTPFDEAIFRNPVHLPVSATSAAGSGHALTILDLWQKQVADLRSLWPQLQLRVVGADGPSEKKPVARPDWLALEADPREYRGTAGLLRDLVADYADEEHVLVAPGRRLVMNSVLPAARAVGDEDVTIFSSRGEDVGLMAVRVSALRKAKDVGFEDFREQFLPRLVGQRGQVVIRDLPGLDSLPARTAADYIAAVRAYHQQSAGLIGGDGTSGGADGGLEHWRPKFSLVEPGAEIGDGVRLFDTIVLAGARVGPGAVLGRCVVGPRGVVHANARLLDALIATRS